MSEPMSTRALPAHPNIAQYKKQAKDLLHAFESSEPQARSRIAEFHPRYRSVLPTVFTLNDAQLVIAREHGESTWAAFRAKVESASLEFESRVDQVIDWILNGQTGTALALVKQEPSLISANIYVASVMGDIGTVRKCIAADSQIVNRIGGTRKRPPLLYAVFSNLIKNAEFHDRIVEVVRLLLENGADPNVSYREEAWADSPLSALYGAAGRFNDSVLTRLLLEFGANPNDGESLYHSVEHGDLTVTRMLFEHGAKIPGTNAFAHVLDYDNLDALQLFIDQGADVNERNHKGETPLHNAVMHNRSLAFVKALIDRGADVNARGMNSLTVYRYAVRHNSSATLDLLKSVGADDSCTDADQFLAACWRGDDSAASRLIIEKPDLIQSLSWTDRNLVVDAASEGNNDAVRIMLDNGFGVETRGLSNATSLHWASWNAHPETVRLLIERGAKIDVEGAHLGSTPLQWALFGTANNGQASNEDYISVIKLLIESGANMREGFMQFASDKAQAEITKWLES